MTKEEKELLLKDLCARLPYTPKIKITYQQQGIKGTEEGKVSCDFIEKIINDLRNNVIVDIQIYLRPMSSMTEEERKEVNNLIKDNRPTPYGKINNKGIDNLLFSISVTSSVLIDFLNANHFDYRGLIPMGLAIEVTEKNNPYKE